MLLNKGKVKAENKPIDKERQKEEVEKTLESIRRFNQMNEELKKTYDEQVAKTKQREEDIFESMQKTEAKCFQGEDKDR